MREERPLRPPRSDASGEAALGPPDANLALPARAIPVPGVISSARLHRPSRNVVRYLATRVSPSFCCHPQDEIAGPFLVTGIADR